MTESHDGLPWRTGQVLVYNHQHDALEFGISQFLGHCAARPQIKGGDLAIYYHRLGGGVLLPGRRPVNAGDLLALGKSCDGQLGALCVSRPTFLSYCGIGESADAAKAAVLAAAPTLEFGRFAGGCCSDPVYYSLARNLPKYSPTAFRTDGYAHIVDGAWVWNPASVYGISLMAILVQVPEKRRRVKLRIGRSWVTTASLKIYYHRHAPPRGETIARGELMAIVQPRDPEDPDDPAEQILSFTLPEGMGYLGLHHLPGEWPINRSVAYQFKSYPNPADYDWYNCDLTHVGYEAS